MTDPGGTDADGRVHATFRCQDGHVFRLAFGGRKFVPESHRCVRYIWPSCVPCGKPSAVIQITQAPR